jgi:4-amino-4-deoxy-L-arabinose transferase-like glycosyltransferase
VSIGVNGINPHRPPSGNHAGEYHSPLRLVFGLTLVLSAVLLFPTIFWPFDYDQGTFAYGGAAVLRGDRPYIDFTDIKPPNIFYTYATAFAIFGNTVRAIRIFDYLNALVTIALLFLLATRLWKNTPWRHISAVMASLAFVLQYYIFGHWDTAQVETYSLPFLLVAMLLVIPNRALRETRSLALRSMLAGLAIAITFYYKFPNALFLVLIGAAVWVHSGHERRAHWRGLTALVGGFVAGVGLESLYLAVNGELLPLWQLTLSSTASYVSTNYSGSFTIFQNIRTSFHALDLLWIVASILGWGYWAGNRHPSAKHSHSVFVSAMLLILGVLIALMIVQFQNKGYTYHYAVLLPWADLLIGAGIGHVARALTEFDHLSRGSNAAALAVALFVLSYIWTSSASLHDRADELGRMARGAEAPNGYVAGDTLANYVTAHTQAADKIFIFGFEPYVYWKSGRLPATKYLNTIHFKPARVAQADRDALVTTLVRNPPALFLVETSDRYTSQGSSNDDSRTTIRLRYPEIEALLATRYTPQDTIQGTIAYALRH